MVNPIFWFDNVVWGQVDSVGVVFLLLGLRRLWRDRPERAAVFTVIAAIVKPQLGILVPLIAVVTIRRALWPVRDPAEGLEATADDPLARATPGSPTTANPLRIFSTGAAGFLTAVALCLPFGMSRPGHQPGLPVHLVRPDRPDPAGRQRLSVPHRQRLQRVGADARRPRLEPGHDRPVDLRRRGDPHRQVRVRGRPVRTDPGGRGRWRPVRGHAHRLSLWVAARRPDRLTLLVALVVLAIAFFALPTRVHERYSFPFFALGAILLAVSPRWRVAYVVLSIATFANMYVVLTTLYPPNDPSLNPVRDWLGIGELIRSQLGITVVAILHTGAFVWALTQLRPAARERLEEEVAEARLDPDPRPTPAGPAAERRGSPPTAPPFPGSRDPRAHPEAARSALAAPAPVTAATWSDRRTFAEAGLTGWIRARLDERPVRADRSATLTGEGGGRLGRLDAYILVVLVLASLGLRTFRLEEPYQMHFDEVYHARTATEFLQSWRYGESHDIYEWTHPHLAKYAMAAGIVLFGRDEVNATSDLGVPVRAAAIEHRREDPLTGERAGERVHIATGDEIRTEDLRTRALSGVVAAPGSSALFVDEASNELIVGFDDGRIATLDLSLVGVEGLEPIPLGTVDHPVEHLLLSEDGTTILAASDDRLTALDTETADVRGTLDLPGIADLALAGTGSSLVATPANVEEPAALASTLVELIGGEATDYESRLAGATGPDATVLLGTPGKAETRTKVEAAITDGRLAGVEIIDLPRVAIATSDGLTFIDPSTVAVSSTLAMDGGAHGLALITGVDDPKLYVTTGSASDAAYEDVVVGGDPAADGPDSVGRHPLPGLGSRVAFDTASQQIHVLGLARRGRVGGRWPVDRLRHRTPWQASRERGVRRRRAPRRPGAGRLGDRRRTRLPRHRSPATPGLRHRRADRVHRRRLACLRLAPARGHRRCPDGGLPVPPRTDPVPATARGRARGRLRPGRRDALRAVADRHERRLRRAVHRRCLHAVRRRVDGLVAVARGVLGRDAGHRWAARAGARLEVGRGLCDRGARVAHAGPQRPRAGRRDPGPRSRSPVCSATWPSRSRPPAAWAIFRSWRS